MLRRGVASVVGVSGKSVQGCFVSEFGRLLTLSRKFNVSLSVMERSNRGFRENSMSLFENDLSRDGGEAHGGGRNMNLNNNNFFAEREYKKTPTVVSGENLKSDNLLSLSNAVPGSDLSNYGDGGEENAAIFDSLHPAIKKRLLGQGISTLFPIQANSFPVIDANINMVGKARTGTGKTLAFVLPIANRLLKGESGMNSNGTPVSSDVERIRRIHGSIEGKGGKIKCLILTPTRELCKQIETVIASTCPEMKPVSVYGGSPINAQIRSIQMGSKMIVATPGRLLDLYERNVISFNDLEYLVLDEADTMLDFGFEKDIRFVLERANSVRTANKKPLQISFFSATMPEFINDSIKTYLNIPSIATDSIRTSTDSVLSPVVTKLMGGNHYAMVDLVGDGDNISKTSLNVALNSFRLPTNSQETIVRSIAYLVDRLLPAPNSNINDPNKYNKVIIFGQRKVDVSEISKLLYHYSRQIGALNNYRAYELHGDIPQNRRETIMREFRDESRPINKFLVCTDVAARGIDISNVDMVINIEPPLAQDNFVHRAGRTGRAGKSGICVTLVKATEANQIGNITKFIQREIIDITPNFDLLTTLSPDRHSSDLIIAARNFGSQMANPQTSLLTNHSDLRTVMAVLPASECTIYTDKSNRTGVLTRANEHFSLNAASEYVQRNYKVSPYDLKSIHLARIKVNGATRDAVIFDIPLSTLSSYIQQDAFTVELADSKESSLESDGSIDTPSTAKSIKALIGKKLFLNDNTDVDNAFLQILTAIPELRMDRFATKGDSSSSFQKKRFAQNSANNYTNRGTNNFGGGYKSSYGNNSRSSDSSYNNQEYGNRNNSNYTPRGNSDRPSYSSTNRNNGFGSF